ncbi:VWA domain-containing protein [Thalassolituus oleivorans]|uniref:VWA domain-containing protein n=1 Tax=Thalassolituus oleivorans TaxID=187493 RepID=UPI0023F0728D|nr:VWA domain-containing protein [Thalassolituus oleivorans]
MRLTGVILSLLLFVANQATAAEQNTQPGDVRIIIDISGSMKDTDPQNLRRPALNLLVELLPDNSRAGVWTFGRYVNMLVPLDTVNASWRRNAKAKSSEINSAGLNTNLVDALDKALWQMAPDSGYQHTVILLTDGRIDMDKSGGDPTTKVNSAERQRLIKEVLPKYIEAGAKIHTLALSNAADLETLQQIAMETDGLFLQANTADDLMPAFLKAFDRAVPAEQVPLTNNHFDIDSSIEEFTALIFRGTSGRETQLISPSGAVITQAVADNQDNVRWHHDLNFDLITVSGPEAGEWSVDADVDPDNRVQILSDLKLSVSGVPANLFSGAPIDMNIALVNEGEVVTEPAVLQLTDISMQVTAPDGRTGSKLLSDPENLPPEGVFRETMSRLSMPGEYRIEVNAIGRTFQRRQVLTAVLAEPLKVETEPFPDQQRVLITVTPQGDSIDTGLSRIIAKIASPDGSSVIQNMEYSAPDQKWVLDLTDEKGDGRYEITINIRGISQGGKTFKSKPEAIVVDFPLQGVVTAPIDVAPPIQAEPMAEPVAPVVETENEVEAQLPPEEVDAQVPPQLPIPEPVVPDLADKYAEQTEVEVVEEDEGIAWWIYLLLGITNLAIVGGAGYWWFSRKKAGSASEAERAVPANLDLGELDDADLEAGDFDDFETDGEEEIPAGGRAPTSMGSDTNINVAVDDFAIDPEEGADNTEDGDDWGEFDAEDELKKADDDDKDPFGDDDDPLNKG